VRQPLEQNVRRLLVAVQRLRSVSCRIVVADNGSTDATPSIARRLTEELPHVLMLRLDEAGRGRALRRAWISSTADVVAYMDADLSTDLAALPLLIDCVASGAADVAIGSRLIPGARVRRSLRRQVISRGYNALVRRALGLPVHDAQCGFKAMRREVAARLLPAVEDDSWFFDTELLVAAVRAGYRVRQIPVTWDEDPVSSVAIIRTAVEDVRGILRLRRCARVARSALTRERHAVT
jgi:glycosyltransferase involved in cell wall biosynthesis